MIRIGLKSWSVCSCPDTCPHAKCHRNSCKRFWVILLTDRQTDKHRGQSHLPPPLSEVNDRQRQRQTDRQTDKHRGQSHLPPALSEVNDRDRQTDTEAVRWFMSLKIAKSLKIVQDHSKLNWWVGRVWGLTGYPLYFSICVYIVQLLMYSLARWLSGRASDLRSSSRGFEARPRRCCVTTLGKLFTPYCLCHQAV